MPLIVTKRGDRYRILESETGDANVVWSALQVDITS